MSEAERKQQEERYDLSSLSRVAVVGIFPSGKSQDECDEHLAELTRLSETYGFEVVKAFACPIKKLNATTFIGSGKAEEIGKITTEMGVEAVIFDDEITPNQQKRLQDIMGKPVLDRTELILEVFVKHASSRESSLQIELAQIKYALPRLKRLWTHLSRERTGGGATTAFRGAGEKQLEIDKRILRYRMKALETEISSIRNQREIQRTARLRSGIPTFAIVGYTNAGKSTLLNALTDADVLVEDKLFATLDTTSRKFSLPNHQNIVLTDTVGFIRKLPHTLVAAFRSTLEESIYTDILLHLIDVSHPNAMGQAETTIKVLEELGAKDKPIITVLNKVDRLSEEEMEICNKFRLKYPKTVRVSAKNHTGFDELMELMVKEVAALRKAVKLRIPQSEYALAAELMREGKVLSSDYVDNDIVMEVEVPVKLEHKVRAFYDEHTD
jgi:GTP-binding protein HflX